MTAKRTTPDAAPTIRRRSLLRGMGGGVAAAVLGAAVAGADAMAQPGLARSATEKPQTDESPQAGYRLTGHIRAYYRSARI